MNDWIRDNLRDRTELRRAMQERFFPTPEPADSPTHPRGDADAGRGEAEDFQTEHVRDQWGNPQPMRVFTADELNPNDKETT